MLSQTAVAQRCADAKGGHDRPFVVEWDATDLSSFEAAARDETLLVAYEGCSLRVLYECKDPQMPMRLGGYNRPVFTSGTMQGFEIANQGELYAKLPLGATTLSGRVQAGESLHLRYFVAGTTTSSRESVYANELAALPGCAGATHFVAGYNLGAFELDTASRVSGVGARSDLAHAGTLASCTGPDPRACRVPIRLALRPVRPGDPPFGATMDVGTRFVEAAKARDSAQALVMRSLKQKDARDGAACVESLDRAIALDPEVARRSAKVYADCLMLAGKCDDGKTRYRGALAADDPERRLGDAALDLETRQESNRFCPSSTTTDDVDFVVRATRELEIAVAAKNVGECRRGFDAILPRLAGAKKEFGDTLRRVNFLPSPSIADGELARAVNVIAEATTCDEGLRYWLRKECTGSPRKGCERDATGAWERRKKTLHCK